MYWNGPAVLDKIGSVFTSRLTAAAVSVCAHMKQVTGIQGPPRSLPGNAPHMDSMELNRRIDYSITRSGMSATAKMGSPVKQAGFMEFGTGARSARSQHASGGQQVFHYGTPTMGAGVAPRPWCLSSLLDQKNQVRGLLAG